MANYFIGVDFGTVHTKVCVREDTAERPTIVRIDPQAQGPGRFLASSMPRAWSGSKSPKVLLCEGTELDHGVEFRAIEMASEVVATGVRAAVATVAESDPGSHRFTLNLGFPTTQGAAIEVVRTRYQLIGTEAIRKSGCAGIRLSADFLDERLSSLALLDRAKFELSSEPLFVVDGGGWTTHLSLVRWIPRQEGSAVSIHGDVTAVHGVHDLVKELQRSLGTEQASVVRILSDVLEAAYAQVGTDLPLDMERVMRVREPVAAAYSLASGLPLEACSHRVQVVLGAFQDFARSDVLRNSWSVAWREGYATTTGSRNYKPFRLLLAGGACRVGRSISTRNEDPVASELRRWQEKTGIPYTEVLYPELDRRFWAFDPEPEPEVVPYFFVAGGYSYPLSVWPAALQRQAARVASTAARPAEACFCSGLSESCPYCNGNGYRGAVNSTSTVSSPVQVPPEARQITAVETEHLCDVCGEVVPSFGSLAHVNDHRCTVCGRSFIDRKQHMLQDHGWKLCGVCGLAVGNLDGHVRRRHPPQGQTRVGPSNRGRSPPQTGPARASSQSPLHRPVPSKGGDSRRTDRVLQPPAPMRARAALAQPEEPEQPFRMAEVVGRVPPEVLRERMEADLPRRAGGVRTPARKQEVAGRPSAARGARPQPSGRSSLTHRPFAALLKTEEGE